MKDQLRLADYLHHMVEAIDRIFLYTEDIDEAGFLTDSKTQDAIIRNFEVIGEAARNIERQYPAFAATNPEVPWGALTRCVISLRMDTSKSILKLFGAR